MSLVAQMVLIERYGLRMTIAQLAEELSISAGAIRNQIGAGEFPIPTYRDGGKRYADARDVAAYLDQCREKARADAQA